MPNRAFSARTPAGPVGTGRTTYAKKKVQAASAARPTSPDWCYVYNFQQPDQPIAVSLPPGTGAQFRKDMDELVTELQDLIRKLFSSERFEERKAELLAEFERRISEIWTQLEAQARELGFVLQRQPTGISTVPGGPWGGPRAPGAVGGR